MDTTEERNGTYFYRGHPNLSKIELPVSYTHLPVINKHIAMKMGMSVLRICLSRPMGLIHENAIHSLALASTESMVCSCLLYTSRCV